MKLVLFACLCFIRGMSTQRYPLYDRTRGGNAGGAGCVIPFLYDGKWQEECIHTSLGKRWCGTTENYDGDKMWGYCPDLMYHRTRGGNAGGAGCVLPFLHQGIWRTDCLMGMYKVKWCATTKNFDANRIWGYCPRCSDGKKWHKATWKCYPDIMYPRTEGGNARGAGCVIPFLLEGHWRADCVQDRTGNIWCGTTENYDGDKMWGYCPGMQKNLARGKPTYQFDEIAGGKPGRAVDGNKNGVYNENSCTHTGASGSDRVSNNWWAVDLVDRFSVQKVVVYNRGDCCGSRLANFDIVVTDTKPTTRKKLVYSSNQVCVHRTGSVGLGYTVIFNCNKPIKGRYVAVVQSRKQLLTLCEVEVFEINPYACSFGFKFAGKNKECVDRCPDYLQRWDGKKCAVRCIASQKYDGMKCVPKCLSPLKYNIWFRSCEAKEMCHCQAYGDPHYYQYDRGQRIDFQGKCKYTFTKLKDEYKNDKCYFNVEKKNVHSGSTVTYVQLVDVTVEDMTFRYSYQTKKVYIDGIDMTKSKFPMSVKTKKSTVVKISYANRQFKVEACGMITSYRDFALQTYISSVIGNKVEGLCGTCNGNRNDDLIPRGQTKATSAGAFSDSWSVPDDSALQPQSNCKSAEVNGDCTVAWAKKVQDNNHCGYITDKNGPFKACIASGLVDVKRFQGSCEFDVCFYSKEKTAATDVPEVVCKNLAPFADACAKQGLGCVWRRTHFCPLQCEANAYYTPKMYPGCEKTCQQRTAPKDCVNDEPEDGCTCKNGYFRLGNDCVLPAKCGCDASDGRHIDSGKSVVANGCTAKYECTDKGTLKTRASPACHKDASCSTVNGLYTCKCNDGFNGNGHSCKPNCPKAEEKWDTKSSKCVLHPIYSRTEGGNAGGAGCAIPFLYAGKWQGDCIQRGDKKWCGTTRSYDADGKWGYCLVSEIKNVTCQTQDQKQVKEGETWSHGGMEYSCGRDGKARKNVKTSAGNCLFPFTYKGTSYETCTEAAYSGKPWCYIDAAELAFGYC